MNKPMYVVSTRGQVHTFEKSHKGLENAIEFCKEFHGPCVCCVSPDYDVEIVWENH